MDLAKNIPRQLESRNEINSMRSKCDTSSLWKQWRTSEVMDAHLQCVEQFCADIQHLLSISDPNSAESCGSDLLSQEQISNANHWIQIGNRVESLVHQISDKAMESQQKFVVDTCEKLRKDLQLSLVNQFDSLGKAIRQMSLDNDMQLTDSPNMEQIASPILQLAQTQLSTLIDEEFSVSLQKSSEVTLTKLASRLTDHVVGQVVDELQHVYKNLLRTIKEGAVQDTLVDKEDDLQTRSDQSARVELLQKSLTHEYPDDDSTAKTADSNMRSEEFKSVDITKIVHQFNSVEKSSTNHYSECDTNSEDKESYPKRSSASQEENDSAPNISPSDTNSLGPIPSRRNTKVLLITEGKESKIIDLTKPSTLPKNEETTDLNTIAPDQNILSSIEELPIRTHPDAELNHLGSIRPKRKRNYAPTVIDKADLPVAGEYDVDSELFKLNELTTQVIPFGCTTSNSGPSIPKETKSSESADEDPSPPHFNAIRKPDLLKQHPLPGMTGLGASAMLAELKMKQRQRQEHDTVTDSPGVQESGNSNSQNAIEESNSVAPPPKPRKPPIKLPKP